MTKHELDMVGEDSHELAKCIRLWMKEKAINVKIEPVSDGGHVVCGNCWAHVTLYQMSKMSGPRFFENLTRRVKKHYCSRW